MRSTLLLCISTLCFLTRITCAAVPTFEDTAPSHTRRRQQNHHARQRKDDGTQEDTEWTSKKQSNGNAEDYHDDSRIDNLARHVHTRIQQCIATTPERHGLLVHIDLSRTTREFVAQDDNNGTEVEQGRDLSIDEAEARLRKRLLETVAKTWKNMPAEQRIAAIGTALSIATVPAWLIGSVQGLAESTIKKAKLAAAKAEILRSMAPVTQGSARPAGKSKRQDVEPSVVSHSSLHPFPARNDDADEDIIVNVHLLPRGGEAAAKYIKVPSSASRVLVEFEDMIAHGGKALGSLIHGGGGAQTVHSAAATVSQAASHASAMSHGVSQAVSKATKSVRLPADHIPGRSIPKEENKTVKKILQYAGAASPIIYFPAAMISFGNADKSVESKGDLTKYRRSEEEVGESARFPLVTCVPITKVEGIDNYVIPTGGLDYEAPIDDDWMDERHFERAPFSVTFAKRGLPPAAVSKIPNPLKLLGVGTMATSIGYIMHRMNQRRDADETSDYDRLVRRSDESASVDEGTKLEKRYTGRIFFAGLLAGTALSKAGFGVPKPKPTIVEKERRAMEESNDDLLRKRGLKESVIRVGRDKVTIALGAMVTGFAAVKSGIAGKIKNAVIKPKAPPSDGLQQMLRRSLAEETDTAMLQRRMNRAVTAVLAAFGGAYLAQRTGRRGQERENAQYEAQLAKLKVNQPGAARRSPNADDVDREGVHLVRRGAGGGASLKKALSYADDLAHSAGKGIGKLLHSEAKPL